MSVVNTVIDRTPVRTYLLAYAAPKTPDRTPDLGIIEAVTPALREQIGVLDRAVTGTACLVGDQFTFAAINLMPILYYVRMLPEGAAAFASAAHLADYYERHAARPSFKGTMPRLGPPSRAKPA